ncbi:DUF1801 domain-containing protein [Lacihabitans sp. LS3-19]|uniref:DUF1801 domain-containing protein n=1 Tax=Lacihabitans sp. LS3-19 TaxID=2487335 RepID=UPI0020CF9D15|nr:DUF1801 domain-containing protein [Lacihabitans sp. LS3-19]MCP9768077.1 DUF1801 domain-containing protein [Lacihabitans sp. LS3-19]
MQVQNISPEVSEFLDAQNHPFRKEIEALRNCILSANLALTENIKWNGPNYCYNNEDRITMRIQPPKQVQLIFHCGAKVKKQPKDKLINDPTGLLVWKENNRAVATFKNLEYIKSNEENLKKIVRDWVEAAK